MKCSWLALSEYVDDEIEATRKGELEAHLVGCERCTKALDRLREESQLVGALARVEVSQHSTQILLEQLNLNSDVESIKEWKSGIDAASANEVTKDMPWLSGEQPGAVLPWQSRSPLPTKTETDPEDETAVEIPGELTTMTPTYTPTEEKVAADTGEPDFLVDSGPERAPRSRFWQKLIDRISVALVLSREHELDDSVHVVGKGSGVPLGTRHRAVAQANRTGERAPYVPPIIPEKETEAALTSPLRMRDSDSDARTPFGFLSWLGSPVRLLAFLGGVLVLLVLGLTHNHSQTSTTGIASSSTGSQSSIVLGPGPSSQASVAPTPSAAPTPFAAPQSFGDGAKGFQMAQMIYGNHPPGDYRVVFELTPTGKTTGTKPSATITQPDASTMVIAFSNTLPGSTGTLPNNDVIASVTQSAQLLGNVTYTFKLNKPVQVGAGYLDTNLVVDLNY